LAEKSCGGFTVAMDRLLRTGAVTKVPLEGVLEPSQLAARLGSGKFQTVKDAKHLRELLGGKDGQTGVLWIRRYLDKPGGKVSQADIGHYVNVQVRNGRVHIFDSQWGDIFDSGTHAWKEIPAGVELLEGTPETTRLVIDLVLTGGK